MNIEVGKWYQGRVNGFCFKVTKVTSTSVLGYFEGDSGGKPIEFEKEDFKSRVEEIPPERAVLFR